MYINYIGSIIHTNKAINRFEAKKLKFFFIFSEKHNDESSRSEEEPWLCTRLRSGLGLEDVLPQASAANQTLPGPDSGTGRGQQEEREHQQEAAKR